MSDPLFDAAVDGDRRSLARAISRIDDRATGTLEAIGSLSPRRIGGPGKPFVLGITGPPGAGKSTFTDKLITRARTRGEKVAVVAVDPSSPFSGGAILGDRLRMEGHATDPNVFIRSLASRGHLGGLSRASGQVVDLLDAASFDLIIVETVGVGQSELAVMEVADTVLVVLTPESGDVVQTMKAGLLEVADLFVVNKSDRPGANALQRNLELMVHLDMPLQSTDSHWAIPVATCSATENDGIDEVVDSALAHLEWCCGPGRPAWDRRRAVGRVRTFLDVVSEDARSYALDALRDEHAALRLGLEAGDINPYQAAADWGTKG
ncbi:MAG: methylmalonyl Co-A mutase-associated GTPase MeaB [Deltaproteobacteria bacterium]|nr:methylmalonyl Co-A mutase-associated GTPase MeaB [Deltaproteobacteria bacterium]